MKSKKLIYIAGPMRGKALYNFPAFFDAEAKLEKDGYRVFNPCEFSVSYGKPAQIQANQGILAKLMHDELVELAKCDAVYLLAGWEKSVGARNELALALNLGLEIVLQDRQ